MKLRKYCKVWVTVRKPNLFSTQTGNFGEYASLKSTGMTWQDNGHTNTYSFILLLNLVNFLMAQSHFLKGEVCHLFFFSVEMCKVRYKATIHQLGALFGKPVLLRCH